jgi:hypothetical protein
VTRSLTHRISHLEGLALPPGLREIATSIARQEGLDPEAVITQATVILRHIQKAGIPMTEAAIAAYLGADDPGETAR